MSTSTFGGVPFLVKPADGNFYPGVAPDGDGTFRYLCTAVFTSKANRNAMSALCCVVTTKRPLGSRGYVVHVDSGPGGASLVVPIRGGQLVTFTAILVGFTNARGY